jgi:AhpD family alkylhydroperoxidase
MENAMTTLQETPSVDPAHASTEMRKTRFGDPAASVPPGALAALQKLGAASAKAGIPETTLYLVHLRASQINGCSVCVDMHYHMMKQAGETDSRCMTVSAWRDAPYFTDAERAALALAEAVTRLSDRPDPVTDAIWNEAAKHYDERALAALLVAIATINVWNRLNVATRQVAFGALPEQIEAAS